MLRALRPFRNAGGLARNREGVTAIEFAVIAPVFFLLLIGIFDIGQMAYARAALRGAVEEAARSSSLETANTTEADIMVENMISPILPDATVTSTRQSYYDFVDIGRPEQWNDADGDGDCNDGEAFVDENRNGTWDADVGRNDNGSAGDVVLYTVTVTYQPVFSLPILPWHGDVRQLTATTVKKNQPFSDQDTYGSSAGTCP